MGKASERRQRKLARYFSELVKDDEEKFLREWDKRVSSWLEEIARRAERLRDGSTPAWGERYIFDVLERAEDLLAACDRSVNKLVGRTTRRVLTDECSRAVSAVFEIRNRRTRGGRGQSVRGFPDAN